MEQIKNNFLQNSTPLQQWKDIDVSVMTPRVNVASPIIFVNSQTLDGFGVTL